MKSLGGSFPARCSKNIPDFFKLLFFNPVGFSANVPMRHHFEFPANSRLFSQCAFDEKAGGGTSFPNILTATHA